jgi:amino acid adenylation domain-containing protein
MMRDLGVQSLLDTAFNFTHFHVYRGLEKTGVEVIDANLLDQTGLAVLADFGIDPLSGAVRLELNCTDLSQEQIDRFVEFYRACLADLAARPNGSQDELVWPVAAPAGAVEVERPAAQRVAEPFAELFRRQVASTPQATAVVCGAESLSYRGLSERANRLAAVLVEHGVGPETAVGVLADRGTELLVAAVAVLTAGGAYLPLDPADPLPRLRAMVDSGGAAVLLTATGHDALRDEVVAHLAQGDRPRLLSVVDGGGDGPAVTGRATGADLACVLFTSGSTGIPKGVMIEQSGLVNHLTAKIEQLGLTASDRVAQTARSTFVVSLWQLLAPLLVGARVVIVEDEVAYDPARLPAELASASISVATAVPSFLDAMLQVAERAPVELPALRTMVSTGETLPDRLARRWFDRYPATALVNAYGQTECSDDVAMHRMSAPPREPGCPIGRAIANVDLHVLDDRLRRVPTGTVGHLHVGGVAVGRGYLGDPGLTASAFRPDPFRAGGRLYATGDLARQRLDGTIECLGRSDRQVKIRGVRVEPGEVEAVLAGHPAVQLVVVAATGRADQLGGVRLVAFVVSRADVELDPADLRRYAAERLPAGFVPAAFVGVPSVPLNANGKVDYAALPWPGQADEAPPSVAPRTEAERAVAEVCGRVLRLESIGAHDDFFQLGADSLAVTVLAFELQAAFGVEVPVYEIYDHPTVAGIAEFLAAAEEVPPQLAAAEEEPPQRE